MIQVVLSVGHSEGDHITLTCVAPVTQLITVQDLYCVMSRWDCISTAKRNYFKFMLEKEIKEMIQGTCTQLKTTNGTPENHLFHSDKV